MDRFRRAPIMTLGLTLYAAALAIAGQGTALPGLHLTPSEMEAFLLRAKIVDIREAGGGVTGSQRATLTDGTLTHDVHIQSVDIAKSVFQAGRHTEVNFKDSYRFNIAGYRLARLLGVTTVPMSVERHVNGEVAALTWWVDDVQMDEGERLKRKTMGPDPVRTSNQIQLMRIWDELIQNRDRNQGNILWTNDWTMWLIDHTRAFRLGDKLLKPNELRRIDRDLLARLKGLTKDSVANAVADSLSRYEQEAVLKRRDRIVKLFEERAASAGDAAVYVDFQGAVR
jgi:hypothetical protein